MSDLFPSSTSTSTSTSTSILESVAANHFPDQKSISSSNELISTKSLSYVFKATSNLYPRHKYPIHGKLGPHNQYVGRQSQCMTVHQSNVKLNLIEIPLVVMLTVLK